MNHRRAGAIIARVLRRHAGLHQNEMKPGPGCECQPVCPPGAIWTSIA
jgi:hypothetical protein